MLGSYIISSPHSSKKEPVSEHRQLIYPSSVQSATDGPTHVSEYELKSLQVYKALFYQSPLLTLQLYWSPCCSKNKPNMHLPRGLLHLFCLPPVLFHWIINSLACSCTSIIRKGLSYPFYREENKLREVIYPWWNSKKMAEGGLMTLCQGCGTKQGCFLLFVCILNSLLFYS